MTKPKPKSTSRSNRSAISAISARPTPSNSQISMDISFQKQQRINLWDSICIDQLRQGKDVREAVEYASAVISHRDGLFGIPQ